MRALVFTTAILSMVLVFSSCSGVEKQEGVQNDEVMESGVVAEAVAESVTYYTCPMEEHSHIHSAEPGECPECGMDLVAAVETSEADAEFYGCPMPEHSNVRESAPGRCPECGMILKPMRLVKK